MTMILDHGAVELIDYMGGDQTVVASARVSNGKLQFGETFNEEKDPKLIKYLMKHRHGTPFEHSVFTFYVKAPIFVTREWMRHRMGSYNEISGRYVEFEPEFYIPTEYRIPASTNKQGSVPVGREEHGLDVQDWQFINRADVHNLSMKSYDVYKGMIARGVAKEMARMVLPVNLYTQFYWTVNARSLMNFLSLRTGDDAQWEIRQYADAISYIFAWYMPHTFAAWEENNHVAP